ncbi:MAG: thiazole synthase [Deltaproteobacteria bacterium]|nr:thiazole synthase [Deltaproteobacteria bacterium]MBN2672176.1 thiazole synthase [Deltaproteobacteria bacterium]
MTDQLVIAGRSFSSRLLVGTGKFSSAQVMKEAVEASGAEIVTVALRRVDLDAPSDNMLAALDMDKYLILANTSGARDAKEAVRLAKIARDGGLPPWVKIEVTPDPRTLLPDPIETLKAAEELVKDGFTVLPYMPADPILAKHLEEVGCATLMPLGAMIGSGMGIRTRDAIEIIIDNATVPVVVDAGLGLPSHAAEAMEMGADAVLANTALAIAQNPRQISEAFKLATIAGRMGYLAGPAGSSKGANASSPLTGFIR